MNNLEIEPELKAILHECIHAQDKVLKKEEEQYDNEINMFILMDKMNREKQDLKDDTSHSDFRELQDFKKSVQSQEEKEERENKVVRSIKRKSGNPTSHKRDYSEENKSFGV